jgi:hypothetical protein
MNRKLLGLIAGVIFSPALYAADDFNNIAGLGSQANFRLFSEDLAAVFSYKGVAPAASMGRQGYDIGLQLDSTKLEHPSLWNAACGCSGDDNIFLPKVYLRLGAEEADLTFSYGKANGTSLSVWGLEAQFTLALEDATVPAVALRANYSHMNGGDQVEFYSYGAELSVSKNFGTLTPYAGFGWLWATSTPEAGSFDEEKFNTEKYYVGLSMALGAIAHLAFEVGTISDATAYSAKLVARF